MLNVFFILIASISAATIAGIVIGSLSFAVICLCGICFGVYFSVKAKKPCVKQESSPIHESSIKLNYSAVENYSSTTDSEQEERLDCYQPPNPLSHTE